MKLLFITQKVDMNDDVLGFVPGWITEFSHNVNEIVVLCLFKGAYNLPKNVKVLSLGKDEYHDSSRITRRLIALYRFFKYIISERKNYDKVFVHMNPEYILLGGIFFKLLGKRMFLWYIHKAVDLKLRLAEKIVDGIFTASRESFGLPSKKLHIVGHGIDCARFFLDDEVASPPQEKTFAIIYVGRISKIKNQELLIRAAAVLVSDYKINNLEINIVGAPIYQTDKDYLRYLTDLVKELQLGAVVKFTGSVPNKEIATVFRESDLSVNLCPTGGVDKAVLESWASGIPCIVLNQTFAEALSQFPELILSRDDPKELSQKIYGCIKMSVDRRQTAVGYLKNQVFQNHNLHNLVPRLINLMS